MTTAPPLNVAVLPYSPDGGTVTVWPPAPSDAALVSVVLAVHRRQRGTVRLQFAMETADRGTLYRYSLPARRGAF